MKNKKLWDEGKYKLQHVCLKKSMKEYDFRGCSASIPDVGDL
jgi:hypothetical protein